MKENLTARGAWDYLEDIKRTREAVKRYAEDLESRRKLLEEAHLNLKKTHSAYRRSLQLS